MDGAARRRAENAEVSVFERPPLNRPYQAQDDNCQHQAYPAEPSHERRLPVCLVLNESPHHASRTRSSRPLPLTRPFCAERTGLSIALAIRGSHPSTSTDSRPRRVRMLAGASGQAHNPSATVCPSACRLSRFLSPVRQRHATVCRCGFRLRSDAVERRAFDEGTSLSHTAGLYSATRSASEIVQVVGE